jgi:hypothetical protein
MLGAAAAALAATTLECGTYAAVEQARRKRRRDSSQVAAAACRPAQVRRDHWSNYERGDAARPPGRITHRWRYVVGNRGIECYQTDVDPAPLTQLTRLVATSDSVDLRYFHAAQSGNQVTTAVAVDNDHDTRTLNRLHWHQPLERRPRLPVWSLRSPGKLN